LYKLYLASQRRKPIIFFFFFFISTLFPILLNFWYFALILGKFPYVLLFLCIEFMRFYRVTWLEIPINSAQSSCFPLLAHNMVLFHVIKWSKAVTFSVFGGKFYFYNFSCHFDIKFMCFIIFFGQYFQFIERVFYRFFVHALFAFLHFFFYKLLFWKSTSDVYIVLVSSIIRKKELFLMIFFFVRDQILLFLIVIFINLLFLAFWTKVFI
jgi:hypothetical protein